jgi:alpha-tubulin suppressor-like RCC1 family protein
MAIRRVIYVASIAVVGMSSLQSCVGAVEGWSDFTDCTAGRCAGGKGGAASAGTTAGGIGGLGTGGAGSAIEGAGGMGTGGAGSAIEGAGGIGAGVSASFGGTAGVASTWVPTAGATANSEPAKCPYRPLAANRRRTLALGRHFSCGIHDAQLGCWGANNELQLGSEQSYPQGSTVPTIVDLIRNRPSIPEGFLPIEVATGTYHACARSSEGAVVCWGSGKPSGAARDDGYPLFSLPIRVHFAEGSVGEPLELAAGAAHTCARWRTDGEVWCWGGNQYRQLGYESVALAFAYSSRPTKVPLTWAEHGSTQITAGGDHTCALRTDGKVWCWGRNDENQLGRAINADLSRFEPVSFPTSAKSIVQITAGYDHSCALDQAGVVFCWGSNGKRQLAVDSVKMPRTLVPLSVELPLAAIDVRAGGSHSCAILSDASVWCWGSNGSGLLGTSDVTATGPVHVSLQGDPRISELAVANTHTCVRREDCAVQCWGGSGFELGDTSLTSSKTLP